MNIPSGFLNVLKPPGMTSAQVVGYVRWLLEGEKVGHGGTLDPEAAGVLPLMIGKAARLFDYMQDKEKTYIAEIAFGAATDTQDAQGQAIATGSDFPDEAAIRAALPGFTGEIWQRPPMFSALKQNGQRLYDLARKGQTADVPKRQVTVYDLRLTGLCEHHGALLRVRCSKGFYVRTLCHDLGLALGCPAHMRFLLRVQSGVFSLANAVTLERLAAAKAEGTLPALLLPYEAALSHLPWAQTPPRLEKPLRNGGKLPASAFLDESGRPYGEDQPVCLWLNGCLFAVATRRGDEMKPRTWLME